MPLLEADDRGVLEAKTVIDVLADKHPGRYADGQIRTMQRRMRVWRMRVWRAQSGPPKEAYFEQRHEPGREGSFDFTHGTELRVTILGQSFIHLIFEFVLSFSGWTWVMLAFGETFEALVAGVQGALWELDGVPEVLRHDNLSAATHELKRTSGRALNKRFADVLDHYDTRSSRITPGKGHENGVSEKAHHLLKSLVEQALLVRGSRDFVSQETYLTFLRELVSNHRNRGIEEALAQERSRRQQRARRQQPPTESLTTTMAMRRPLHIMTNRTSPWSQRRSFTLVTGGKNSSRPPARIVDVDQAVPSWTNAPGESPDLAWRVGEANCPTEVRYVTRPRPSQRY